MRRFSTTHYIRFKSKAGTTVMRCGSHEADHGTFVKRDKTRPRD